MKEFWENLGKSIQASLTQTDPELKWKSGIMNHRYLESINTGSVLLTKVYLFGSFLQLNQGGMQHSH